MRRKRVELEQAVITAARAYVKADQAMRMEEDELGLTIAAADDAFKHLANVMEELDEFEVAELTGGGARWVNGSPETSRGAAGLAVPVQGSARHKIVAALSHVGRLAHPGYTDAQLEHLLGASHQTTSSARNWLVEAGWVIDSGVRRLTPSKRQAVVWMLSEAGWAKLREGR